MNRKRLIAMGIIMTLSMSTVACGKKEEKTEISKVAVEVENPTTGELTNDTTYIGTVEPQPAGICDSESIRNSYCCLF